MNPSSASPRFKLLCPQTTGLDPSRAGGDLEEPLPGTVCVQFIRCGKPNCRCRKGLPHGPYFYRIWRNGRTVEKVYVRASDVERVRRQCAQYHVLDEELRALRALRARRLAYTARLWTQIRRAARLRQRRGP